MYIVKNSKIPSLLPSRSVLALCPREVWERAGERTPSQDSVACARLSDSIAGTY